MNISFSSVNGTQKLDYSANLDRYFNLESRPIKKVNYCNGLIRLEKVDHILICKLSLKANINVISSYTDEPFNTNIFINDELYFSDLKDMDGEDIIFTEDNIDIDYYVYSLIITSIPIDIHKKGEKLPSGEGYRVIKEDDFNKEPKGNVFDKLKGIDFDK